MTVGTPKSQRSVPIHCPKKSPVKPEGPHRHYWSQEVLVIHQTEGAGCRWIMMEISWCCGCSGFQRLVARSFLGWWMMVTFNHIWAELWLPDSFNFESMNDLYRTGPVKVMMPNDNLCNRYFQTSPDGRIGRSNFLQLLGATGAALFAGSRRCRAVLWQEGMTGSPSGRMRSNIGISRTLRP